MKKTHLYLSTAALVVATSANAQLITIGDNLDIFLTGTASVNYEDNVLKVNKDKTDDTYFIITPGAQIATRSGTSNIALNAWFAEEIKRYSDNSKFNDENVRSGVNLSYDTSKTNLSLKASYNQYDIQGDETSLRNQERNERGVAIGSFYGRQYFLPKVSLGLGVDYVNTDYKKEDLAYNRDYWAIPVNLYYNLTEQYAVSLGYRFKTEDVDHSGYDRTKEHFVNVGVDCSLTAKVSGYARIGYNFYDSVSGESDEGLGWDVGLNYAMTALTSVYLNASGDFGVLADSASASRMLTTVGLNHKLLSSLTASLRVSYDNYNYIDMPRVDQSFFGYVGFTWAPTSQPWSVNVGYQFQMNDPNKSRYDDLAKYKNNYVTLGASIKF